jgi:hypothetical protein
MGMVDLKALLPAIGKGPGFVAVALLEVIITAILAWRAIDLTSYALALAAINGPLYGAGAWKAHSDNSVKNAEVPKSHP